MAEIPREGDVFPRPSIEEIRSKWDTLFSDPLISTSRLKSNALSKEGLGQAGVDGGVVLRSLHWRFYHNLLPPPTSLELFSQSLSTAREGYNALRRRFLVAPDGRWASDCTGSEEHSSVQSPTTAASLTYSPSTSTFPPNSTQNATSSSPAASFSTSTRPTEGWDPLSLSTSSPWKTWFAHVDLRTTIFQDVERTFPDIPYFQLPRVRKCLTTSLFLFAALNPDVGYRQGMHELLACCFLAVDRDSLGRSDPASTNGKAAEENKAGDAAMWQTLDRRYVEHDAFELFTAIMKGGKAFYEWRAEEGPVRTRTPSAPQAPIITRCNNIHSSLIRRIDPQLWERLETEGVEAQIWAIRWIRLLFTRELPFPLAMRIWDGVFAEDPGLGMLDFVCVAMLLLIRNELIEADYPTLLTSLLHYPAPLPTYPFEPSLILSQALFLKNNISPAAGVEVVIQNQDILGVKASPPERSLDDHDGPSLRIRGVRPGGIDRGSFGRGRGRSRAGVGGLAQGLFERAQAAGLDKAFMSTVADLRKNLPDSATAYSYLPNLPFSPAGTPNRESGSPFSSIPSSSSALPSARSYVTSPSVRPQIQTRPSIDSAESVQSLKDAELEMAELRLAMVGMGKAMSEWLDLLRPATLASIASPSSDTDQLAASENASSENKMNAWKGLEKIKDSLLDAAGKETEDIVREWGWHDGLEASSSRASTPAPLATPASGAPQTILLPPPVQKGPNAGLAIQPGPSAVGGPGLSAPVGREELEFEDSTPTPLSTSVFPSVPQLPSSVSIVPHLTTISSIRPLPDTPSSPAPPAPLPKSPMTIVQPTATYQNQLHLPHDDVRKVAHGNVEPGGKPTLRLSSRGGTPSIGIPRVPMTAPPSNAGLTRYTPEENHRPQSASATSSSSTRTAEGKGTMQSGDGDPLAGLGVGMIQDGRKPMASFGVGAGDQKRNSAGSTFDKSRGGSKSSGFDPLGVGAG
ncbi:TBC1 domain family member 5 [Kwoniella heveanensis BCC8398]|uniref:TBC1 domain family member 5 n=1 Tax=Kwoniella heveanensis BCC8398 TaxID=1296120 RepID=A0A1B9GV98_9TREE|nr:TBC1 domain family member 5 [Kwoniella heveanensis BCC8398]